MAPRAVSGREASVTALAIRCALVVSHGPTHPCQGRVGEFGLSLKVFDAWAWRSAGKHALAPGVVGRVEVAQRLLQDAVRIDVDAEYLAADAAVEAFDHAVGLGRMGAGVPVGHAQLGAGFGKGRREAVAVVGQHMGELEGERGGSLTQDGDGAALGFVVLDGEVDGARATVDGDEQVALAPLAVARLQVGQVLDVDVDEA